MAGNNQFVPFGTGAGANVTSAASWAANNARQQGFVAGVADPTLCNTAWRQPSVIASMIGSFIASRNYDALDNGDLDALLSNFNAALVAFVQQYGVSQTDIVNYISTNYAKGSLIGRQNFTVAGTYTYIPSSTSVRLVRVTVVGGGGGGGATASTDNTSFGAGGGGGGGGTAVSDLLLSTTGVPGAAIIVGPGGTGSNSVVGGITLGGTGGTSSFGSFLSATGGGGGHAAAGIPFAQLQVGGTKGSGAGGTIYNISGQTGYQGTTQNSSNFVSGAGGTSYFGGGGVPRYPDSPGAGNPSDTMGSGGSGAAASSNTSPQNGGNGAAGAVLIEEYA